MRFHTKERARLNRQIEKAREEFRTAVARCQLCWGCDTLGIHEIASGNAGRPLAIAEPATWLLMCNGWLPCHRIVDGWPKAKQLALKQAIDPTRYDLEKFNACYTLGRILQDQVDAFAKEIASILEFVYGATTREALLELS